MENPNYFIILYIYIYLNIYFIYLKHVYLAFFFCKNVFTLGSLVK